MDGIENQFDLKLYQNSDATEREKMIEGMFKIQYPFVYRLSYTLCGNADEAEDIAQEVFIAAIKGLVKFRGDSQLRTWLYRITTRISGRHLARKSKQQMVVVELEDIANCDKAESEIEFNELVHAIGKLSLPLRTVLSLVAIEGLSHQLAADVLGVPIGTIWSRLHKARKQLADNLKG